MKIAVEYIKWLQAERERINKVPLDEIQFFRNGILVDVDRRGLEDFQFTGLNNIDFITTGYINKFPVMAKKTS